jgi:hypothetical protein
MIALGSVVMVKDIGEAARRFCALVSGTNEHSANRIKPRRKMRLAIRKIIE